MGSGFLSLVEVVMNVFLTGATGFVGGAIAQRLVETQHRVRAAVRRPSPDLDAMIDQVVFSHLTTQDWSSQLEGQELVIHSAARVHVMSEQALDPLEEFRRVNVEGTLQLAKQAAQCGVRRFIFISSIKVNGEATALNKPYRAEDAPSPQDPYGISKYEAEQQLLALAAQSSMEVVIVRPVLVYGPGVKANFRSMMSVLSKGVPLPLGAIHNKRSMVALDNLVDLIMMCAEHPRAANQVFLASDGEDLSSTELLRRTAKALGRPARLVPVPAALLVGAARLLGRPGIAQRLCGSLQVDIEKNRVLLGWTPPVSVDRALTKTASHFLEHR